MNRQEYIAKLREKNGYCNCSELAKLSERRKKVERLERECEQFRSKMDYPIIEKKYLTFLKAYRKKIKEFADENGKYQETLQDCLDEGRVLIQMQQMDIETVNCASCHQQIAVLTE